MIKIYSKPCTKEIIIIKPTTTILLAKQCCPFIAQDRVTHETATVAKITH